jgi:hypothetical protein
MKTKRYLLAVLVTLFFTANGCHHNVTSIIVDNGKERLEINYSGQIKFTEDELAIQSMTKNSRLKYWQNDRKLLVKCDANGAISYEMSDNGRKLNPEDAEGKKFLAEAIQGMIAVGYDAQGRIKRIAAKGGISAVLKEVGRLGNDYVKSMYLESLITCDSIRPGQLTEVAEKIGDGLGSDYEKGKLLGKFPTASLKDSVVSMAYIAAVGSVGSDYEKANAIKHLIKQPLSKAQLNVVLTAANGLGSDFEKANILKELIHQQNIAGESLDMFLRSANRLGSDFEKANVLKEVVDQKLLEGDNFKNLLHAVSQLGSDFEKANVLRQLTNKKISTEEQWINLIEATALVSSEFEKCNILVLIAGNMPKSDPVKASYMKAVKTIQSDHEYGRAVRAMD